MPEPSNIPETEVTQQKGEKEPYGPTRTKSEQRKPRTVVPCAYVEEKRSASLPRHDRLVSGTKRETVAGGRLPKADFSCCAC